MTHLPSSIRSRTNFDPSRSHAVCCLAKDGWHVDWDCCTGELGLWLRKPLWGRGYSGERAGALLELAFERLDLDLVASSYIPDNEQSERAITKYIDTYGGQREGHLRKTRVFQDNSVHDEIRYSISQDEYRTATD